MIATSGKNKYFHFGDLKNNDYNIIEIAQALSNTCRFNGHCDRFYSVAEHSSIVAKLLPKHLQRAGLLHDAAEAYIGDIVRPFKKMFPQIEEYENELLNIIYLNFDIVLTDEDVQLIKRADNKALFHEGIALFPDHNVIERWGIDIYDIDDDLIKEIQTHKTIKDVKIKFLNDFVRYI